MDPHVKALATEPDNLSFQSPGPIHGGRRERTLASFVISIRMLQHVPPRTINLNKYIKF